MALDWGALGLGDKIGIGLGVSSLVTGLIGDQSKANTERYRAKSAALNFEHLLSLNNDNTTPSA